MRAMIRRAFPLACTGRQLALSAESCGPRRSSMAAIIPIYTHPSPSITAANCHETPPAPDLSTPTQRLPCPASPRRAGHGGGHLALDAVAQRGVAASRQEATED